MADMDLTADMGLMGATVDIVVTEVTHHPIVDMEVACMDMEDMVWVVWVV
jgi:hypothetical protein